MTFPTEGEDATLYYKDIRKEFPVPYVLYVDFESFLQSSEGNNTVNEHVPSGFCCLKVSKFDDEIFPPYVYSGPDVMSHFYKHIYSEQETICEKLGIDKDMLPLTDGEKAEYQNSTTCPIAKTPSTKVGEKSKTPLSYHRKISGGCVLQMQLAIAI